MNLHFRKKMPPFCDSHEKPWGGIYTRRTWKRMLVLTSLFILLSALAHYAIYRYYLRPIVISEKMLTQEIVNLDKAGLDKAVADIKNKEAQFKHYLTQKIDITDPAK